MNKYRNNNTNNLTKPISIHSQKCVNLRNNCHDKNNFFYFFGIFEKDVASILFLVKTLRFHLKTLEIFFRYKVERWPVNCRHVSRDIPIIIELSYIYNYDHNHQPNYDLSPVDHYSLMVQSVHAFTPNIEVNICYSSICYSHFLILWGKVKLDPISCSC